MRSPYFEILLNRSPVKATGQYSLANRQYKVSSSEANLTFQILGIYNVLQFVRQKGIGCHPSRCALLIVRSYVSF